MLLCLCPNLMFLMLPLLMLLLHVLLTGSELIAGLLEDVSTAAELVHVIQTLLFLKKSRPQDLIVSQGVATSMSSIGKRNFTIYRLRFGEAKGALFNYLHHASVVKKLERKRNTNFTPGPREK